MSTSSAQDFPESAIALKRPVIWSQILLWLIVGTTTAGIFWAFWAKFDQTVLATGKLEPSGAIKEIKAPIGGVVQNIPVKDGQVVKKDQVLVNFNSTIPEADLIAFQAKKAKLIQQNEFYNQVLKGQNPPLLGTSLDSLIKFRNALNTETQYYQASLGANNPRQTDEFNRNQERRLVAIQQDVKTRISDAELQIQALETQRLQAQQNLASAQEVLQYSEEVLDRFSKVVELGGVPRIQYANQKQQVASQRGEVNRFAREIDRLTILINRAKEQKQNTVATVDRDLLTKIVDNQKQIAEIDSQIGRIILENEKEILEIDSQIRKAKLSLEYQAVKSPVDGTVFDLKPAASGYVTNSSEILLKIVPQEGLVASVFINNKEIGFIRPGMEVDVRIDSYPSTEYGSIPAIVESVGSDALPPEPTRPYDAFPVKIRLKYPYLIANNQKISLQSGMSLNCSIKIGPQRTLVDILWDQFDRKVKSVETIR